MERLVELLAGGLAAAAEGYVMVVTGAGVSHGSGLPTFRGSDPGAIWKQSDLRLATRDTFLRDPVSQWRWYLERFRRLDGARPNAAHRSLVRLEERQAAAGGRFLLVTQNIDTLHEQAGSRRLIKVHGSSDRLRCSRPGCRLAAPAGSLARKEVELAPFLARPARDSLPRCPECDALLRAHVLFFDELYTEHRDYRFDEVEEAAQEADLLIFAGTSFAVGVTDLVLSSAVRRGVPVYSVDPAAGRAPAWAPVDELQAPAEELLPAALDALDGV